MAYAIGGPSPAPSPGPYVQNIRFSASLCRITSIGIYDRCLQKPIVHLSGRRLLGRIRPRGLLRLRASLDRAAHAQLPVVMPPCNSRAAWPTADFVSWTACVSCWRRSCVEASRARGPERRRPPPPAAPAPRLTRAIHKHHARIIITALHNVPGYLLRVFRVFTPLFILNLFVGGRSALAILGAPSHWQTPSQHPWGPG